MHGETPTYLGPIAGCVKSEQAPRQSTRYVDATSEVGVFFLDAQRARKVRPLCFAEVNR